MSHDLYRLTARAMVDLLRRGKVSPREAIDAALARIRATDGAVNALPTLCPERAYQAARTLGKGDQDREAPGWLAGLPIAVKDLNDVAGVRTTLGSLVYKDRVPNRSDVMVETLEKRGAIVLAKSNTPEFGAGANTFNEVFGKTRNPWHTAKTAGGSSGGAAAALASGQVWLATGSDLGGSLRVPASFCAVVGLRPSPGRVARAPAKLPFDPLWVEGPMARTVDDLALMLDAMAGPHPEDPLSLPTPSESFQAAAAARRAPKRVAFSRDLGIEPVAGEIATLCERAARRFQDIGVHVDEACPDLKDAPAIFATLRAALFVTLLGPLLETHRDMLKPEVVWNVEQGMKLTADEISRAEHARAALYYRTVEFFRTYDLLLCPAVVVAPFDVDTRFIAEVEGRRFNSYFEWLALTIAITRTACPALSLPCGFTGDGLPVGLQMVAGPRGEAALLSAAAWAEEAFGVAGRLPIDPVGGR